MTLRELRECYAAGETVVKPDEAAPWEIVKCSRASFYRAMAAGQVPGVLTLGKRRRLLLGELLAWLGAPPDAPGAGSCQCAREL